MSRGLLLPLLITLAGTGAYLANEWGDGALTEAVGMGHRHLMERSACEGDTPMHGHGYAGSPAHACDHGSVHAPGAARPSPASSGGAAGA